MNTRVEIMDWPYSGSFWNVESVHENGSLQVRIEKGCFWAGRMISVRPEDVSIPQEEKEELDTVKHEIHEDKKEQVTRAWFPIKKIITYIAIIVIATLIVIWSFTKKEQPKPAPVVKTQLELKMEELNSLNIQDIKDIEALKIARKWIKERKVKKDAILKWISDYQK